MIHATLQFDVKGDEEKLEPLWETIATLMRDEVEEITGGRITDKRRA